MDLIGPESVTHPAKVKPQLLADGPPQVWTWDISKLRGPPKGIFYQFYVLIDIYCRFDPGPGSSPRSKIPC